MRVDVELGCAIGPGASRVPAMIDLEELLATRLLVQGNSGSGKSHLLRRILEQSAPHVQEVVVDPEGDFVSLSDRFGHLVIEADRSLAELECIAGRVRQHRVSAVLNLESLEPDMQMRAAAAFLNALFEADRDHWYPVIVAVDEAQLFAPALAGDGSDEARKASLGAMTNLMCRGRKRGLAGIIATQRLAKLAKNVAAEASNFLMGRTFLDIDMARAVDLLGMDRRQAETFRDLERGRFIALGPALSRRPLAIEVGSVATGPRAGTPKLMPLPDQAGQHARDLILAPVPAPAAPSMPSRRAAPPQASTNEILDQLARHRPPRPSVEDGPPPVPADELEAVFRAVARETLEEADAAFRPEAALYHDFQARCRIVGAGRSVPTLAEFRFHLNIARAGVHPAGADAPAWEMAVEAARLIPPDLQPVFLILAGAALTNAPCPSDADIARRCGSHSAGRARSQIRHLERSGHLTARSDLRGNRLVRIVDLGWDTAPGNPGAATNAKGRRLLAAE
jgi:hypothetical protein